MEMAQLKDSIRRPGVVQAQRTIRIATLEPVESEIIFHIGGSQSSVLWMTSSFTYTDKVL